MRVFCLFYFYNFTQLQSTVQYSTCLYIDHFIFPSVVFYVYILIQNLLTYSNPSPIIAFFCQLGVLVRTYHNEYKCLASMLTSALVVTYMQVLYCTELQKPGVQVLYQPSVSRGGHFQLTPCTAKKCITPWHLGDVTYWSTLRHGVTLTPYTTLIATPRFRGVSVGKLMYPLTDIPQTFTINDHVSTAEGLSLVLYRKDVTAPS